MGREGQLIQLPRDGELLTLLVSSKDSSTFTVMHSRLKAGTSHPIHYHENDHEAFYVVSGCVRFIAGSESQYVRDARNGTIVVCPPYCNRGYQGLTDSIMIIINYPSGPGEGFIREYASSVDNSSSTATPIPSDVIKKLGARYGIHMTKTYSLKDIKPQVVNLSRDGPLVAGDLCFSHGSEDEDQHKKAKTLWLFACDTNNKIPHSLPVGGSQTTGPEVFCVGRA